MRKASPYPVLLDGAQLLVSSEDLQDPFSLLSLKQTQIHLQRTLPEAHLSAVLFPFHFCLLKPAADRRSFLLFEKTESQSGVFLNGSDPSSPHTYRPARQSLNGPTRKPVSAPMQRTSQPVDADVRSVSEELTTREPVGKR